jgi:integrase/recombinase XerD
MITNQFSFDYHSVSKEIFISVSVKTIALRFENWPEADKSFWERSLTARSPLDMDAPQIRVAKVTVQGRHQTYGAFLMFVNVNFPWLLEVSPADRVTPDLIAAYVTSLNSRLRASSVYEEVNRLATVMAIFDRKRDWSWLRRIPNMPSRQEVERSKKKIVPPDPATVINAALQYFDKADGEPLSIWSSIRARDALIVVFAGLFALRRQNLQEIERGVHLLEDGSTIRLAFNDTLKNNTSLLFDLPRWLTVRFQRYLKVHRSLLLGRHSDKCQLWVSRRGTKLSDVMIGTIFKKFGHAKLGRHFNVHSLRHALAHTIILHNPGDTDLAAATLGHKNTQMVSEVYTKSAGQEFGKAWHKQRDARKRRLGLEI